MVVGVHQHVKTGIADGIQIAGRGIAVVAAALQPVEPVGIGGVIGQSGLQIAHGQIRPLENIPHILKLRVQHVHIAIVIGPQLVRLAHEVSRAGDHRFPVFHGVGVVPVSVRPHHIAGHIRLLLLGPGEGKGELLLILCVPAVILAPHHAGIVEQSPSVDHFVSFPKLIRTGGGFFAKRLILLFFRNLIPF